MHMLLQAAIALGQLSNVMGCLSTYGIGSAPPYFAAGYVPQSKWYQLGFIMSVWYILVWLIAGGAWWKVPLRSRMSMHFTAKSATSLMLRSVCALDALVVGLPKLLTHVFVSCRSLACGKLE